MHITKVYKPHWPNCSHKCTNMWVQFILSPANVTCVVHKIKISRQVWQNVKKIWKPREKKPILTNTNPNLNAITQKIIDKNIYKMWRRFDNPQKFPYQISKKCIKNNFIKTLYLCTYKMWIRSENPRKIPYQISQKKPNLDEITQNSITKTLSM